MILYSGKTDKEAGYDRYCRRMGRDLKNIRQIGTPAEGDRIYIENAAYARCMKKLMRSGECLSLWGIQSASRVYI